MNNFTTDIYQAKREIFTYAEKLSQGLPRPTQKFVSDMVYGMISGASVKLSDIATSLKEPIQKANTIDRLSRHLSLGITPGLHPQYLKCIKPLIPKNPVVLVDDSDISKPYGNKFENLGFARDGSDKDARIGKGYHQTEMVFLSDVDSQPVSLFSHIHSSLEKDYKSANTVTYHGIKQSIKALCRKATYVFDRGYDANDLILFMYEQKQDFILRLTKKRKLFYKGRWLSAPTLCNSRKGKFKTTVFFQGVQKECYISHLNVQVTASKENVCLVLIYGLSDVPMMLLTNKHLKSKDDVVSVLRTYMSRWRIEEYFRFKKQHFHFEDFRVRKLKAMNSLNQLLTYSIAFLTLMGHKRENHRVKAAIFKAANPLRKKVQFFYYQIAKGLVEILSHAKEGIRLWHKPRRRNPQLVMKLIC